jgi:hypothetical protein
MFAVSETIFLEELFDWCASLVQGYAGVSLKDFNTSWRDGLAISAILEQYDNYRVSFSSISSMVRAWDIVDHSSH